MDSRYHRHIFICVMMDLHFKSLIMLSLISKYYVANAQQYTFLIKVIIAITYCSLPEVSNLWPPGHMQPRMAMNVPQHKIVNLLKTFFCSSVFVSVCVFSVWPKTTLLLPVWPRDSKRSDTPATLLTFGASLLLWQLTCAL